MLPPRQQTDRLNVDHRPQFSAIVRADSNARTIGALEMRTVEDYAAIRYAYHVEHKTIRQISRELDIARQTVRKAVETAIPSPYTRTRLRPAPVLGPFKATLDRLLAECAR